MNPLREIFPPHSGYAIPLFACILFTSCASKGPTFRDQPDYSTAYLGPNGEIFFAKQKGPKRPAEAAPPPEQKWTWFDEGARGAPSIVIDLSEQTARFYKGDVEVGTAPVSTGREGYSTPAGNYSVIEKDRNHISTLYGDYVDSSGDVIVRNVGVNKDKRPPGTRFQGAPMPYFLRVTGAVGMHAGHLPGYAASHGCIRLPRGAAEKFFENSPPGTPVSIVH
ncbi:MAG: L,D-transpeptidase family protein [Terrimicrobiaceae bacterium]